MPKHSALAPKIDYIGCRSCGYDIDLFVVCCTGSIIFVNYEDNYIRGGRGNSRLVSWSSSEHEDYINEIDKKIDRIKSENIKIQERINKLKEPYQPEQESKSKFVAKPKTIEPTDIDRIKLAVKHNVIIFMLRFVKNEHVYDKLTNIIFNEIKYKLHDEDLIAD